MIRLLAFLLCLCLCNTSYGQNCKNGQCSTVSYSYAQPLVAQFTYVPSPIVQAVPVRMPRYYYALPVAQTAAPVYYTSASVQYRSCKNGQCR